MDEQVNVENPAVAPSELSAGLGLLSTSTWFFLFFGGTWWNIVGIMKNRWTICNNATKIPPGSVKWRAKFFALARVAIVGIGLDIHPCANTGYELQLRAVVKK